MQLEPEALRTIVQDRALVRLVLVLDEVDGYPTRMLLKKLASNELHSLLPRAEKEGYIRREMRKQEGKGNHRVCNYLTEKGRTLVDIARQIR